MNNRRRGFGAPDTELADKIRTYAAAHPQDSKRKIADAVGCHRHTVSKVLRAVDVGSSIRSLDSVGNGVSDSNSSIVHDSNISPLLVNHPKDDLHFSPIDNAAQTGKEAN